MSTVVRVVLLVALILTVVYWSFFAP